MKRFQTLMTGISAVALVAAFAAPSLAAKTVIEDEELDEVTAAGQPKIAQSHTKNGSSTAVNFQISVFATHIGGQENLTALTLNNVFGENQVANGTNIQAGNANTGDQDNELIQSWGSAKAYDYAVVKGAKGGNGGAACGDGIISKCAVALPGNAAPGAIAILWEFADEIADATNKDGDALAVNSVITVVAGAFDVDAQTNLTALTVNNVVGFNQVANGLNISGGGQQGADVVGADGEVNTAQSNKIEQWRGAPKGWTDVGTFSTGNFSKYGGGKGGWQ